MHVVRTLARIFLAVYLIFQGLFSFLGINTFPNYFESAVGVVGLVAGVLMFISFGGKHHDVT